MPPELHCSYIAQWVGRCMCAHWVWWGQIFPWSPVASENTPSSAGSFHSVQWADGEPPLRFRSPSSLFLSAAQLVSQLCPGARHGPKETKGQSNCHMASSPGGYLSLASQAEEEMVEAAPLPRQSERQNPKRGEWSGKTETPLPIFEATGSGNQDLSFHLGNQRRLHWPGLTLLSPLASPSLARLPFFSHFLSGKPALPSPAHQLSNLKLMFSRSSNLNSVLYWSITFALLCVVGQFEREWQAQDPTVSYMAKCRSDPRPPNLCPVLQPVCHVDYHPGFVLELQLS